jgi:hypothetical protein
MRDQSRHRPDRDLDRREVGREPMVVGDGGERIVTDAPALHGVVWCCLSNLHVHDAPPYYCVDLIRS